MAENSKYQSCPLVSSHPPIVSMRLALICSAGFGTLLALVGLNPDAQSVSLPTAGLASSQIFDTLANTGTTLTGFDVACTGEPWRLGTITRIDQIDFQYSLNAKDRVTGSWTDVSSLDFVTLFSAIAGARDGNTAANPLLPTYK